MKRFRARRCRTCQGPFRPKCGRQLDCAKCRKAKGRKPSIRTAPILDREPIPCRECSEEFVPKQPAMKYCPSCRARRKAMGSAVYKLQADKDEVRPAKPGARPGDFVPPTTECHRCAAVVRLDRPEEYRVIVRDGGKHGDPADRLVICPDCWRERRLKEISADMPADGLFAARSAAAMRCLTILLGLPRDERLAAWEQLERAFREVRA